ncbi:MAG TPA: VapE domain-containing protein [Candidatus Kapabacteria bacterium]|jgi:hypothetical protein|nr:VapE domain-containing protein [Candidatus Kapabacteria bacterium]
MDLHEVTITVFSGLGEKPSTVATTPHVMSIKDVLEEIAKPNESMVAYKRTCVERYDRYRTAWIALKDAKAHFGKDSIPEAIRAEYKDAKQEYDTPKSYFPCAFFSGIFSGRNDADITTPSGFIIVDVDGKDQDDPVSFGARLNKVKADIYTLDHVQAVFTSPSEDGLHILVRVDPKEHTPSYLKEFYRQVYTKIADDLKSRLGLASDASCRNVGRACFISPDPDILVKDEIAKPFPFRLSKTEAAKVKKAEAKKQRDASTDLVRSARSNNRVFADAILAECKSKDISLTESYENWIKVGLIVKREFGDDGLDLFMGFSALDPTYDPDRCRTQWAAFEVDDQSDPVTFATLVWMARQSGVSIIAEMPIADQVERYIEAHYELRMNELDKGMYWRPRGSNDDLKAFDLDYQEDALTRDLQKELGTYVGIGTVRMVLRDLAYRTPWNPMRDYLNALQWDGVDRIGPLMASIQTDNDVLFRRFFPKWFVGIVAGALGDRANDKALVFTGPQGVHGKTYFFANLLPKRANGWSFVHVVEKFDPTDKDDIRLMLTAMLIVFDEMAAYAKADLEQIKSVISKEWIMYRGVWGKSYREFWKTASFAGCTNHDEFLRDTTGDRRYLVFKLLDRDKDAFDEIDKKELLAQAVAMFKEGYDHKLTSEEYVEVIERNRQAFTSMSTDEIMLHQYLEASTSDEDWWSLPEIISRFRELYKHDLKSSTVTLGKNLSNMGMVSKPKYRNGRTVRLYQCKFVQPVYVSSECNFIFGK